MAEYVNRALEQMLPEFEDMQNNGLFTRQEIRDIVKKRRNLEYQLQRRIVRKVDFLRYIQYEINLEKERNKRKHKLGMYKKNRSVDYAIVNRIHHLFQNALRKFGDDAKLWLDYIQLSKQMGSTKVLSRTFSRLLDSHPYVAEFWIMAAKWEFEDNNSIENARHILQLGIRKNSLSEALWLEYFRLELLYVDKLRKRRQVLGMKGTIAEDIDEKSDDFFTNKTANVVYQNAIKAINDNIEFRVSFIKIYKLFECTEQYRDSIYNSLLTDFPNSEQSWHYFAQKQYDNYPDLNAVAGHEMEELVSHTISMYEEALNHIDTAEMWDYYILWLYENVIMLSPMHLSKLQLLMKLFQRAKDKKSLSEKSYKLWVRILLQTGKDMEVAKVLNSYIQVYCVTANSWIYYLTTLISHKGICQESDIEDAFREALRCLSVVESMPVWELQLQWYLVAKPKLVSPLLKKVVEASPEIARPMQTRYLEWAAIHYSIARVRKIYTRLIANSTISNEFLIMCIDIEEQQAPPNVDELRKLYDNLLSRRGSSSDMWMKYVKAERAWGDAVHVNKVYWKAIKTLTGDDNANFVKSFSLL